MKSINTQIRKYEDPQTRPKGSRSSAFYLSVTANKRKGTPKRKK